MDVPSHNSLRKPIFNQDKDSKCMKTVINNEIDVRKVFFYMGLRVVKDNYTSIKFKYNYHSSTFI